MQRTSAFSAVMDSDPDVLFPNDFGEDLLLLTQRFRCHSQYNTSVLDLMQEQLVVDLATHQVNCRHSFSSIESCWLPSLLNHTIKQQHTVNVDGI